MTARWIRSTAGVLGVLGLLGAQSVPADEFDDFRIPEHRRTDWSANLGFLGERSSFGSRTNEVHLHDFRADASTDYSWLSDSDPATTRIEAFAASSGSGWWASQTERTASTRDQIMDSESRNGAEAWNLAFEHRRYPWRRPIGFSIRSSGAANYLQRWGDDRSDLRQDLGTVRLRELSSASSETWGYFYVVSTDFSVGVGRVRDATAVYEARLLESRLRESRALTRDLSPGARRQLAALMSVRDEYEQFRERPAKSLWQRVETLLQEDGALSESGLDAHAILRAGERSLGSGQNSDDLPRSPFLRRVGWFVGPLLSDSHRYFLDRTDVSYVLTGFRNDTLVYGPFASENHTRRSQSLDDVSLGFQAQVARPFGLRWQADFWTRALFPIRENRDGCDLTTIGALRWMVADRWTASASFQQSRWLLQKSSGQTLQDAWLWRYGVNGTYYVEDHLQITLSLVEEQHHTAPTNPFVGDVNSRSGVISLALGYRILGGFRAPGLMAVEGLSGPR